MNTENLNRKIVSGCKALTIDHDARTYHIGDRVIPFSSCVIKITLNSEFPMYEGYESLRSEVY